MGFSTVFPAGNRYGAGQPLNPAVFRTTFNAIRDVGLCQCGQACPFPKRRP
jgi:hypothetical protein